MNRKPSKSSIQGALGERVLLRQGFLVLVFREDLPLDDIKQALVVHFIAAGGQSRESAGKWRGLQTA